MFVELLKIIEGGISKDQQKVINYSKVLAEKLKESGEDKLARKIIKLIDSNNLNVASLDSLISKPFDQESKLEMVNVILPVESSDTLFFNEIVENEVTDFILSYLKKDKLISKGINTNNNLLLFGPPGNGKTSVAKYISFQLDLPLVVVKLDSLISSMLGSTSKNIRKVFEFSSKKPCILFLDEFDVIAKIRDDKHDTGELKRVVNSLLQNIDEFGSNNILIAATNHHELLDKAVWRRFDKILKLDFPDKEIRIQLIEELLLSIKNDIIKDNKKLNILAELFSGDSPADIKTVINGAIKKSILNDLDNVTFYSVIYEKFLKTNLLVNKENSLIKYLYENGVTQKEIVENTQYSIRKVRNVIKEGM